MAVLHDYFCSEHGIFEAWEAKCPMKICKGEISKVFLQPVGLKSDKTKATDKNLSNLALDFGMTDIKSTREGEHQSGYLTRNNKTNEREFQEAAAAMRRAGIADEIVSGWIYEQKPDWMPQLNPHPYFDDEEED